MKINPFSAPSRSHSRRQGAATVEAALIVPVLIAVTLMAVDIAQYINLSQLVTNASREGARIASRNSSTSVTDVETAVLDYFSDSFPHLSDTDLNSTVQIVIRDKDDNPIPSGDLTKISSGDPISVSVSFDFDVVRWMPGLDYWNGGANEALAISRRE